MHPPAKLPLIPVVGSPTPYPVARIFCVGRNYLDHVQEMGHDPERKPPIFFSKWAQTYVADGGEVPYPPRTADLQHEVELVVAIGADAVNIAAEKATDHIFGYAVGLDMTRRDLQLAARDAGQPWDIGKNFDFSAPIGPIAQASACGHLTKGAISLTVNGETRQLCDLENMIWPVAEIISQLSTLYALRPGDLIMTGTPAGVGSVRCGDKLVGMIEGLQSISVQIA
ncbi:MAG: fumarylacetoacetate hydrolase family protein [Paracoccaceae bacterium]|nr:fumarylacetoacetate hydrolase family protein [Paracoccaceae bacterium]